MAEMKPCRFWSGNTNGRYGVVYIRGGRGQVYVHRLTWENTRGPIPDGLFVLHRCDNPLCYEPDHLWLGTQHDNLLDARNKGRLPDARRFGVANGRAKLTPQQVIEIRSSVGLGKESQYQAAARYGVSRSLIRYILAGTIWRSVG